MKGMNKQVKNILREQMSTLRTQEKDFIMKNVPRFHRLLMERFPFLTKRFDYWAAVDPTDSKKLTLLKGKKIIAKNY